MTRSSIALAALILFSFLGSAPLRADDSKESPAEKSTVKKKLPPSGPVEMHVEGIQPEEAPYQGRLSPDARPQMGVQIKLRKRSKPKAPSEPERKTPSEGDSKQPE